MSEIMNNDLTVSDKKFRIIRCNSAINKHDKEVFYRDFYTTTLRLSDVVYSIYPEGVGFTVSINGLIIPEEQYETTYLKNFDNVVLVPVLHGKGGSTQIFGMLAMVALAVLTYGAMAPALAGAIGTTAWGTMGATVGIMGTQLGLLGAFAFMAGMTAISMVGGLLIDAIMAPDAPGGTPTIGQSFSWNPVNTQQQGLPIPMWYGMFVCKTANVIGAYRNVTDGNQNTLNALLSFGLGPIEYISDVKINDQPASNYNGVTCHTRLGLIDQTLIPNFDDTITEYAHNVILPPSEGAVVTPVVWEGGLADADAFEVVVEFPMGWYYVSESGNMRAMVLDIRIEISAHLANNWIALSHSVDTYTETTVPVAYWSRGYWTTDWSEGEGNIYGAWVEIDTGSSDPADHIDGEDAGYIVLDATSENERTIQYFWRWRSASNSPVREVTGEVNYYHFHARFVSASSAPYRYEIPANLKGSAIDIRITRLTGEYTHDNVAQDVYFGVVRAIYYNDFQYPRQALLGVSALANDQISGGFSIEATIKARKIFYYTGTDWVFGYNNNPAYVCLDILVQPLVSDGGTAVTDILRYDGISLDNIDLPAFIAWATFCDTLVPDGNGGTEKRFEFNGGFDYQGSLWEIAMKVCEMSRASLMWVGNKISVLVDQPTTATQLFTMGNQGLGSFSENFLPDADRASSVEVSFINEDNSYERDQILIYDPLIGNLSNRVSIQLLGCTKASQAWRIGKYLLNKNRLIKRTITFEAEVDAIACNVGDVVNVQSDYTLWGEGGRIVSGTTSIVVLDKQVYIDITKTYHIMIRSSATDTLSEKTVVNPVANGYYNTITVSSAFPFTPALHDVYTFGESTDLYRKYRVSGLDITSEQQVTIFGIEYNEEIYNDDSSAPVYIEYDSPNFHVPNASNLVADERIYIDESGVGHRSIEVTWLRGGGEFDGSYNIWIVRNFDGSFNWELLGNVNSYFYRILDVNADTSYLIGVQSVGSNGIVNPLSVTPTVQITTGHANISSLTGPYRPNLIYNPVGALGDDGWDDGQIGWPVRTADSRGYFYDLSILITPQSYYTSTNYIAIEAGLPITLSAELLTSGLTAGSITVDVIYFDISYQQLVEEGPEITSSIVHGWTDFEDTKWVPATAKYVKVRMFATNHVSTLSGVRDLKLEYGTYATQFIDPSIAPTVGSPVGTYVGTMASVDVATAATNFNTRNDRDGSIIPLPTIASDLTALDYTVNDDGSVNVSFEWKWEDEQQAEYDNATIDGWGVLARASTTNETYTFGTDPPNEHIFRSPSHVRAWYFMGIPGNLYYTIGLFAYRNVDPDVINESTGLPATNRLIVSAIVQPTHVDENPYQPVSEISFNGNITGTINGSINADEVNVWDYLSGAPVLKDFVEIWEGVDRLDLWTFSTLAERDVILNTGVYGGKLLRIGNNNGDDYQLLISKRPIPYDPNKLYRVTTRARLKAGSGTFFCGLAGFAEDGTTLVNINGANSLLDQHYCTCKNHLLTQDVWTEHAGYLYGHGTADGNEYPSIGAPGVMHTNVRYVAPIFMVNYPNATGITDIDEITVQVLDINTVGAPEGTFVGTMAALDVAQATEDFNNSNNQLSNAINAVTNLIVSSTLNDDGSANISVVWDWAGNIVGMADNAEIDGFAIYGYMDIASDNHVFFAVPAEAVDEYVFKVTSDKRVWKFQGLPANRYYTIGVMPFRRVDTNIGDHSGWVFGSLVTANAHRPNANVVINDGVILGETNPVTVEVVAGVGLNFNTRNDRNGAAITAPTFATNGTAMEHTLNDDGSCNIRVQWLWGGTLTNIDGFRLYGRGSTSATAYTMGTTPAEEYVIDVPAQKLVGGVGTYTFQGLAVNLYYTLGVQAFRIVDPDVNANGVVLSAIGQPTIVSENPYRPSATVNIGTGVVVGSVIASNINNWPSIAGTGKPADYATKTTARSGAGVPAGALGDIGDTYLNTDTNVVYLKIGASTWAGSASFYNVSIYGDLQAGTKGAGTTTIEVKQAQGEFKVYYGTDVIGTIGIGAISGDNTVAFFGSQTLTTIKDKVGLFACSGTTTGIYGQSTSGRGIQGLSTTGVGVYGQSSNNYGVHGYSAHTSYAGVYGSGAAGTVGVAGETTTNAGVAGYASSTGQGVSGISVNGYGVYGQSTSSYAIYSQGHCHVTGNLTVAGTIPAHVHGNITNTGYIGSTANNPLITTTGGQITISSFGGTGSATTFARADHYHGYISNTGYLSGASANVPLITTTGGLITGGGFGGTGSSSNFARADHTHSLDGIMASDTYYDFQYSVDGVNWVNIYLRRKEW